VQLAPQLPFGCGMQYGREDDGRAFNRSQR